MKDITEPLCSGFVVEFVKVIVYVADRLDPREISDGSPKNK